MRRIRALLLLPLLSACSGNLATLKDLKPTATDFNSALAAEYLAYGESEKELGRKADAEHFAAKGLAASKGKPVAPEEVKDVPVEADKNALIAARASLITALKNDDVKEAVPQKAARAQLLFDCWQHQVALRVNQALAPCADEFSSSLNELQNLASSFVSDEETVYTFTFEARDATLDDDATAAIREIAERVKMAKAATLQIEGHIQYYAHKPVTKALVSKRMLTIRQALIDAGINSDHIKLMGPKARKAKSHPVVLSSDTIQPRSIEVVVKTHKTRQKS